MISTVGFVAGVAGKDLGGAGTTGATTGGASTATGGANAAGTSAGGTNTAGTGPTLLESCVLLLHLDEPAWNGTPAEVRDSSGLGNHGTAVGGITTGDPAKFLSAGQFNASGYVSLGDNDSLRPTSALTVVGAIDKVAIWRRALTADEIRALYLASGPI